MMHKFILSAILGSLILPLIAQKKVLDHPDFDTWNFIESPKLAGDGSKAVYVIQPGKGDSKLIVYHTANQQNEFFERGSSPFFSEDGKYLIFKISPPAGESKIPDTLAIRKFGEEGGLVKFGNFKKLHFNEKWKNKVVFEVEDKENKRTNLVCFDLISEQQEIFENITHVAYAEKVEFFAFSRNKADSLNTAGVFYYHNQLDTIHKEEMNFRHLTLQENGQLLAYLANPATASDSTEYALFVWNNSLKKRSEVQRDSVAGIPDNWIISEYGKPVFSQDGKKLFFGTAPQEIRIDLKEEDRVEVEVWSWNSPILYTRQEQLLKETKEKSYRAVYHLPTQKSVQIATMEIPNTALIAEGNAMFLLGWSDKAYQLEVDFNGTTTKKDLYLLQSGQGDKKLIGRGIMGDPLVSPAGKYIYWYSYPDTAWMAYSISLSKIFSIGANAGIAFHQEEDDHPDFPPPHGLGGWTTSDDFVLLYDKYDIWMLDPTGNLKPNNLTKSRGEGFVSRYVKYNPEDKSIEEVAPMLFHVVHEQTRHEGYQWFNLHTGVKSKLIEGPFRLSRNPIKAKSADLWIYTKETFNTFPDLILSEDLKGGKLISDANPQQIDYYWGSIEHYEWTSSDGQKLRGLLAKPDDFDPNRSYPMIVNFYERSSDALFQHRAPEPHRSQINYTFYTSRGYLVFNPDIPYKIGYPGESAFNAVVSGTVSLIDKGFVDRNNIGIQGHSWGGYQIAYILTRTNLFKCAESGAPVVNMFSAYGGIRWGTGLSRQFQYEKAQSRIGGSMWDYPIRFLENSPLFFLDKMTTPVLIMHNDEDAAVPWYQGIEYFMALRRLGKPAWLLNYNGEPHWPVKRKNRMDFQQRMQEFFDFYLKSEPMPEWMKEGIPAHLKGINALEFSGRH
jgi:acetyl esterase/lipase